MALTASIADHKPHRATEFHPIRRPSDDAVELTTENAADLLGDLPESRCPKETP